MALSLYALFAGASWHWWAVSLLVCFFVHQTLAWSVGLHRLWTHRAFETSRFWEYMIAGSVISSLGPPAALYAHTHLVHHEHADTERDSHLLAANGWRSIYRAYPLLVSKRVVHHFGRDRLHRNMRNYYWAYLTTWLATLGLALGWHGPAFVWALPVVVQSSTRKFFLTYAIHKWGYRSFPTGDNSRNNWWAALFTGGEGWHNNHHHDPTRWSFQRRWWELDLGALAVRCIRKRQPRPAVKTGSR
jgi:stearoyl-CoA desaturase (delta-9 desaturase)